jgi:hypothetical protein
LGWGEGFVQRLGPRGDCRGSHLSDLRAGERHHVSSRSRNDDIAGRLAQENAVNERSVGCDHSHAGVALGDLPARLEDRSDEMGFRVVSGDPRRIGTNAATETIHGVAAGASRGAQGTDRRPAGGAGLARSLDRDLSTVIGTALDLDSARRYASVMALAEDLSALGPRGPGCPMSPRFSEDPSAP